MNRRDTLKSCAAAVLTAIDMPAAASTVRAGAGGPDNAAHGGRNEPQTAFPVPAEQVETIEQLRRLAAPPAQQGKRYSLEVLHHGSPNDAGGGFFYWDPASGLDDDGGSVIKPTNTSGDGRWIRHMFSEKIYVEWWGASNRGEVDAAPAINAAIDYAARSPSRKKVGFLGGSYLLETTLNLTSSATMSRCGIVLEGNGRRAGVQLIGNTGKAIIDLSGSAWCRLSGLYITAGKTRPASCAIIGGSIAGRECLYHTFDHLYIELYDQTSRRAFGTVGIIGVGMEECTFIATQIFASTPILLSSSYSVVKADYPSPYMNGDVSSRHSQGVSTFSGETSLVTFDKRSANVVLYGANSTDMGNVYFGNMNIGQPGNDEACIRVLGGTLEGMHARCKIEGKSILVEVAGHNAELYGWDCECTYGGGSSPEYPVILVKPEGIRAFAGRIENLKLEANYYLPEDPSFSGKKLIDCEKGTGYFTTKLPKISNIEMSCNQNCASSGSAPLPAAFLGIAKNVRVNFDNSAYYLTGQRHKKNLDAAITFKTSAEPSLIASICLPNTGTDPTALVVTITGLLSSLSDATAGSGQSSTACIPIRAVKSVVCLKSGVFSGDKPESSTPETGSAAGASSNADAVRLSGIEFEVKSAPRGGAVDLLAKPAGSGREFEGMHFFLSDVEVEMSVAGRPQRPIYII